MYFPLNLFFQVSLYASPDYSQYWYLFPIGILIATLYNSTGISGANFWIPVYILWLAVDPLFGSIGGLIGHTRHKTINYPIAKKYALISIPFAVAGAISLQYVNKSYLFLLFGIFALSYGFLMLFKSFVQPSKAISNHDSSNIWRYLSGACGGLLTGLISVGLGPLLLPHMIQHKNIRHHSEAVGTTVLIVFLTSLTAVIFRLNSNFISVLTTQFDTILSILLYVIPGVIIGGQLGPVVAKKLKLNWMKIYVAFLLITIGFVMLFRWLSY